MINTIKKILVCSLLFILGCGGAFAQNPYQPRSLAPVLKDALPAVVNIAVLGQIEDSGNAGKKAPPASSKKFQSVGSGVIISADRGIIITNAHVIHNAKVITVILKDGRHLRAKKIAADAASDIALLRVHAKHLTAIGYGDSDLLQVGDFVAAIGNPYGLRHTVTSGMVSALHRNDLHIEGYEDFIQTDAPINPGNSGGALINMKGQLVGMNTAIIGPDGANVGIGFAIPSNMIVSVARQLLKTGKVQRGLVGVIVQQLTPALAEQLGVHLNTGAVVTQIVPDSPAAHSGLRIKDVITSAGSAPIDGPATLRNAVGLVPVKDSIKLKVYRGRRLLHLSMPIMSNKALKQRQSKNQNLLHGVQMTAVDGLTTQGRQIHGVLASNIDYTSPAWFAGLRPGDIITEINNRSIQSVKQAWLIAQKKNKTLLLKVHRGVDRFIVVSNS